MPVAAPKPEEFAVQRAIVLRSADADVVKLLKKAQQDVIAQLNELLARPVGIGRDVRIAQLNLVRRNLSLEMGKVWRQLGDITEARRAESAARAIDYAEQLDAFKMVSSGVPGGEAVARAIADSEADAVAGGIDRLIARTTGASYVPLAQRVYNSNVNIGQQIDRLVNSAITRGLSAREFAKEVREFINPATPGGVRYAAMRLARTEINNAAHAVAVHAQMDKPWVTAQHWNLSGSHGRPDICNQLAKGGPNNDGNYPKGSVPAKPHPQCLCFVTPVSVDEDEFLDNLVAGKYESYISKYRDTQPGQVIRSDFGGFPAPKPAPKPIPKPTSTVPKPAKATAKPPTQAAPPKPGAPSSPGDGPHDATIRKMLKGGSTVPDIYKELAKQGVKQIDALKMITRVRKDTAGGVRAAKAVAPKPSVPRPKPAVGRSAAPSARVSPGTQIKLDESDTARIRAELKQQSALTPNVAGKLRSIDYADAAQNARYGAPSDAFAYYIPSQERIFLSREVMGQKYATRTWPNEKASGWCSRTGHGHDAGQSVFAHEFGHHVANYVLRMPLNERLDFLGQIGDAFGIRGPQSLAGGNAWVKANERLLKVKVSTYGTESFDEFLAEIWQEYSTSGAASRPEILKVGRLMQSIAEREAS